MKTKEQTDTISVCSFCFYNRLFLLLMSVFTKSFFSLMRGHLMPLSLFSTWHSANFLKLYDYLTVFFTFVTKLLEGLKDGIKCSGMMMVVFFEILRAVFSALRLITKLPNPLR